MQAREFLAQQGADVHERNLFKNRLSAAELRALAGRAGGARALVKPTAREQVETMTDDEIVTWLEQEPARLRRPIIDTGERILLGFTKGVREALS